MISVWGLIMLNGKIIFVAYTVASQCICIMSEIGA